MNQFRKYIYLLLLMISGIGLFFGDVSLSPVPSSDGTFLAEYHFTASEVFATDPAKTNPAKTPPGDNNWTETGNNVIKGINFLLGVVTAIASVAVGLVGWLLSPDWTSGDLFGLRQHLYALWVTVSNIIYFIYAIALIVVAVMTMFNSKNYGYRELLPRLVVGILMVPFTWWAVQWAVSVSTVLTASVLTIPRETISQSDNKNDWWNTPNIPTCIATGSPDNKDSIAQCNDSKEKIRPKEFSEKVGGIYGSLVIYAYGVFRMHEVEEIPTGLNAVKTAIAIAHKGLVGAVMFLIFGILMIALVFVLVLRVFKLWAYAIFSPLFTFGFVFKDSMKGADSDDTFTVREFLGLVFLPAIIGLVLSFGLILINALNSGNANMKEANKEPCTKGMLESGDGCTIAKLMGNPNNTIKRKIEGKGEDKMTVTTFTFGGIKMKWYGGSAQTVGQTLEETNGTIGFFSAAGGAFGVIILDLIAIIFVWIAFMAAKNVSKTANKIITPVENAGKSLAETAKKMPMYTKLPGIGNLQGLQLATQKISQIQNDKMMDAFGNSALGKMTGFNPSKNVSAQEVGEFRKAIEYQSSTAKDSVKALRDVTQKAVTQGNGRLAITTINTFDKTALTDWYAKFKKLYDNNQTLALNAISTEEITKTKIQGILNKNDKWSKLSEIQQLRFIAAANGWDWTTPLRTFYDNGGKNTGDNKNSGKPKEEGSGNDTDTSNKK